MVVVTDFLWLVFSGWYVGISMTLAWPGPTFTVTYVHPSLPFIGVFEAPHIVVCGVRVQNANWFVKHRLLLDVFVLKPNCLHSWLASLGS